MSDLGLRINVANTAVSQYTGLSFDSLSVFNGVLIGGGTSGIFKLEGNTDAGTDIAATFKSCSSDLGISNTKRMRSLLLMGEFEGDLEVYPVVNDDEGEVHTVVAEESFFYRSYKIPVNRDNQGKTIGVVVKNKNSSRFILDSIDVLPVIINTR
jgi:hypothetical protein